MKNWKQGLFMAVIAIIALVFSFTACSKSGGGSSGGGKSLNSAAELREYLDKQPANSVDNPIKVSMKANDAMLKNIAIVISESGKYVSLDLSGSPLTEIPSGSFFDGNDAVELYSKTLVGIIIPNTVTKIGRDAFAWSGLISITIPKSVTNIGMYAFIDCINLTSVTFEGTTMIEEGRLLIGDLEEKYLAGGIGTYTRPDSKSYEWTKQ